MFSIAAQSTDEPYPQNRSFLPTLLLILGDLALLISLAFFRWMVTPPGVSFSTGLLVALLPYAVAWLLAGAVLGVYNARSRLLPFLGWSLLSWFVTWLAAEIVQAAVKIAFFQVFPFLLAIFLRFVEGAVLLLVWRCFYWIFYAAIFQARRPLVRTLAKFALFLLVVGGVSACLPRWVAGVKSAGAITSIGAAPARPAALVFGAGLWSGGVPSSALEDRVATAADLYKNQKVDRLIFSGNGLGPNGDETQAMRQLAVSLGVPEDAILLDGSGLSTYASCYRVQRVYHLSQAVLVSQRYHLARALFLCNALGVDSLGVPADRHTYSPQSVIWWALREYPASLADVIDLFRGYQPPLD